MEELEVGRGRGCFKASDMCSDMCSALAYSCPAHLLRQNVQRLQPLLLTVLILLILVHEEPVIKERILKLMPVSYVTDVTELQEDLPDVNGPGARGRPAGRDD